MPNYTIQQGRTIDSDSAYGMHVIGLVAGAKNVKQPTAAAQQYVDRIRRLHIDCAGCKSTFRAEDYDGNILCPACFDYAGWENAHSDDGHSQQPDERCPVCRESAPVSISHAYQYDPLTDSIELRVAL